MLEANMVGPSPIKKPPKITPKEDKGDFSNQLNEELRQGTIHKLRNTCYQKGENAKLLKWIRNKIAL